jgi:hypothetical protein
MRCKYCNQRLGFTLLLSGQSYCSEEHRQLHLKGSATEAFERLRTSFIDPPPKKPLTRSATTEEPAPVQPKEEHLPEPTAEAAKAAENITPTVQIASLADAVHEAHESGRPSAPSAAAPGSSGDQAASAPSEVEEPVFAAVISRMSRQEDVAIGSALPFPLFPQVSQPSPDEVLSVVGQASWIQVPQGYPPVAVSASATLVLDTNPASFIALPIGEPCAGEGPASPQDIAAIPPPSGNPALPSAEVESSPARGFAFVASRPLSPASDIPWRPRLGNGPAELLLSGTLDPDEIPRVRIESPASPKNWGELASCPGIAGNSGIAPPPVESSTTPSLLPTTVVPCRRVDVRPEQPRPFVLASATYARPLVLDSKSIVQAEPGLAEIASPWVGVDVALQFEETSGPRQPALARVPFAGAVISPARPSALNYPALAIQASPESGDSPAFRLLGLLLQQPAPGMHQFVQTRPLSSEPCRLPVRASEREWALSAAYLHPSLPSPWSLITWSRSVSISIPARAPSSLQTHAAFQIHPWTGAVQSLRPLSASRRWHRLKPLRPRAAGPAWSQAAPAQASVLPRTVEPVPPGAAGTEPLVISKLRVEPPSMSAFPLALTQVGSDSESGLRACGPSSADALKLDFAGIAPYALPGHWEPQVAFRIEQPALRAQHHGPEGPAPCPPQWTWDAIPPASAVGNVETFAFLKRSVWSLTTRPALGAPAGLKPSGSEALIPFSKSLA